MRESVMSQDFKKNYYVERLIKESGKYHLYEDLMKYDKEDLLKALALMRARVDIIS